MISVMMYQNLTRSLPFLCKKRGYYTIDKLVLVCSDLLLETELVTDYDQNISLYVYPRPIDYTKIEVPFRSMLGTVLTKRLINEDPFEFKGIREYQTYDIMNKINWKASAKAGSLMVNVYDHTASRQVKILLNFEPETLLRYEELEEESIRLAATFAECFIRQGVPTSVYTNGRDCITRELLKVSAGSDTNHVRTINEALARIDTSLPIPVFTDALMEELNNTSSNEYILLISSYQKKDLLEQLFRLVKNKVDFFWIVPINDKVKLTVAEELKSHVLSWEIGGAA
jgi:uncharacterized protein (DUF58 family)